MIGNILAIIGLIFTIGFGIYSIWVYKKSIKEVSIELKNEQCYSLFRDDVKRLNIEIVYDKKTLTNSLILLKAKILNNGSVDIDKNRIFKPLKIISQKEFIWLDAKSTIQPNGSTTNINILNSNVIEIDWDLLKAKEFIEFEALVEIRGNSNLDGDKTILFYEGLKFDYRITGLNNIQKEHKNFKGKISDKIMKFSKSIAIIAILTGVLLVFTEYYPSLRFLPQKKEVIFVIDNGVSHIKGCIDAKSNGDLIFNIADSDQKINIPIEEFNKKYKIITVEKIIVSTKFSMFYEIIGFIYILLGALMFVLVLSIEKKKKVKKKLEQQLADNESIFETLNAIQKQRRH
jgi:hypothetical protein